MSIRDDAEAWMARDPDPETRDELALLLERDAAGDAAATADLESRFAARLRFGTAGLRGAIGAGSNRMNRVVLAETSAALAAYLIDRAGAGTTPTVVVASDGRRNSRRFALDAAEVFAGAGVAAVLLPELLPTPVLAFAVRRHDADAGVMITASHNPPGDNGYKVYLGGADGGSQIIPPVDDDIARRIDAIAADIGLAGPPRSVGYRRAGDDTLDAYVAATAPLLDAAPAAPGLRWVYTALHGVGHETLRRVVEAAGFPQPIVVEAQVAPDAGFPTVAFPNPEEPGALDLAFDTAREHGAELVLAHDPDADRLAVALPDPDADGGWRRLSGNDVGLLLGWHAARHAREHGAEDDASLASSIVSSPALELIAEHYGLDHHTTPTGFKWISRAPGLVYGYEEALGYLVNPETVRDKDGISAAAAVLRLAAHARARGETLADVLAEFRRRFGHHLSGQVSLRAADGAGVERLMASLRAQPPTRIGETKVRRVDDFRDGLEGLPPADLLRLALKGGGRVLIRPSGTEPKLKVYVDVRGDTADLAESRLAAILRGAQALVDERS